MWDAEAVRHIIGGLVVAGHRCPGRTFPDFGGRLPAATDDPWVHNQRGTLTLNPPGGLDGLLACSRRFELCRGSRSEHRGDKLQVAGPARRQPNLELHGLQWSRDWFGATRQPDLRGNVART